MGTKGRGHLTYSLETKKKAIELRLKGMTKQKVAEELGIVDVSRLKVWMRRYNQMGEFGLLDTRGKREKFSNKDRYVRRLEMENAVLKKWLAITKTEVYQKSVDSLKSSASISPLQNYVNKLDSPEADSTPTKSAKTVTRTMT